MHFTIESTSTDVIVTLTGGTEVSRGIELRSLACSLQYAPYVDSTQCDRKLSKLTVALKDDSCASKALERIAGALEKAHVTSASSPPLKRRKQTIAA